MSNETGSADVTKMAIDLIHLELIEATAKFGAFHSAHEGYAVLAEEVDELWDEVKSKPTGDGLLQLMVEAIQVGAMAARMIIDVVPREDVVSLWMGQMSRRLEAAAGNPAGNSEADGGVTPGAGTAEGQ